MCFHFQVKKIRTPLLHTFLFFLRWCCSHWNPSNYPWKEQKCLAKRHLSHFLWMLVFLLKWWILYFRLKWYCFRSCLTFRLMALSLMRCNLLPISGLLLTLLLMLDSSNGCDCSWARFIWVPFMLIHKSFVPRLRIKYYFYRLLGASHLLWSIDFWADSKLPNHTLPHSFFLKISFNQLIINVCLCTKVLDFSARVSLSSWGACLEGCWWATEVSDLLKQK